MEQIMGTNKRKSWKKKAAAAIVVVCALASSIPALAYQKPREYVQSGTNDWSDKDILVFAQNGERNPMEGGYTDFGHGDKVFIRGNDKDYEILECSFRQGQQGQKQGVCAHSYVTGTIAEHDRHADGSCTVVTYEAQQCEKCARAVLATSSVITPSYFTCAKSRTRFKIRFASLGVPRLLRAISSAPPGSMSTFSTLAEWRMMTCSSSTV